MNTSQPKGQTAAGSRVLHAGRELAIDLRYALRSWLRQPSSAAIAVISLAAGIGLNTAVFGIINTIFFQSLRGVDAVHRVVSVGSREPFTTYREVRDSSRAMSGVATWQPIGVDIRIRDVVHRDAVPVVSNNYFAVLGVRPALGRFFDAAPTRQPAVEAVAVLDYVFWVETLGGDPGVLGQTVAINRVPATIVGVAPREFHGFGPVRPPLWLPMGMKPAITSTPPQWEAASEAGWRIFGRLETGATTGDVTAELQALAARSPAIFPNGALRADGGRETWSGPVSPEKQIEFLLVVVLPLVVVGLILWIGCSNVANLLLARAAMRRKEIAIRLANGATRWRVIKLLLTESLLLATAGALAGVLLASWTLEFVRITLPEFPRLAVEFDGTVALYTALVSLVATLLFGLAPALHATRVDVAPLLKGQESALGHARRSARLRTFFLATQFASSVVLLVVAGTFVRTVIATHVGEQAALVDRLVVAYVESSEKTAAGRQEYWGRVREAFAHLPDVTSVTIVRQGGETSARLVPEGSDPGLPGPSVAVQLIDGGFFRTFGIPLVSGHDDLSVPSGSTETAVINERAARQFWGSTQVVGRRFALDDRAGLEIIGIVRDNAPDARVFRRLSDESVAGANIVARSTQRAEPLVPAVRAVVSRLSDDQGFTTVSTFREANLGGLHRLTRMAVTVAALVLALASIGLYGSVSFVTSQRTREIAIRLAIGAPRIAVMRLLAREGLIVVAGGSAIGLVLTLVAFQFMSGMIFAKWAVEPLTVLGVLLLLSLATAAACFVPGRRATRIEPMAVLRGE